MDAPATPPGLGPLEAKVMRIVWATEPTTVRQVLRELQTEGDRDRAYTTIMTICTRLADKGLLARRREGKTDIYSSVIGRDDYEHARAESAVDLLVDEVGDLALVQFARRLNQLDDARRAELERLARGA